MIQSLPFFNLFLPIFLKNNGYFYSYLFLQKNWLLSSEKFFLFKPGQIKISLLKQILSLQAQARSVTLIINRS